MDSGSKFPILLKHKDQASMSQFLRTLTFDKDAHYLFAFFRPFKWYLRENILIAFLHFAL